MYYVIMKTDTDFSQLNFGNALVSVVQKFVSFTYDKILCLYTHSFQNNLYLFLITSNFFFIQTGQFLLGSFCDKATQF